MSLPTKGAGGSAPFVDFTAWEDSFTDTNGVKLDNHTPETGGPYVIGLGDVDIQTGTARFIDPTSSWYANPGIADGSSRLYTWVNGNFGLWWQYFRYQDANNYLQFQINTLQDKSYITKVVASTPTVVDTSGVYTLDHGAWYDVRITFKGQDIKCYVDGTLRNAATIAEFPAATWIASVHNTANSGNDTFKVETAIWTP